MLSRCWMCTEGKKTVDHILIHRSLPRSLYNLMLYSFGVTWVMPKTVKEVLVNWRCRVRERGRRNVWVFVPHYIWVELVE